MDIIQTNKSIIKNHVTDNSHRTPFIVIHDSIIGNDIYLMHMFSITSTEDKKFKI